MNRILHQLAGTRVPLEALVGQFHCEHGERGPLQLIRLANVCLCDGTLILDDYWCALTAGMRALHLLEGDRIRTLFARG